MAEANSNHGNMDISAHQATYKSFMKVLKWSTIFCAIGAVLAAIFSGIWHDGIVFFLP